MRRTDCGSRAVIALLFGCGSLLGGACFMPASAQNRGFPFNEPGLSPFGSNAPKVQQQTPQQAANEAFQVAWGAFIRAEWSSFDRDAKSSKELESGRELWSAVARAIAQGATDLSSEVVYSEDTVLHAAARFNDLATVQTLVARGFKVDTPNHYLMTPLHRAAETDAAEVATFLLKQGADPNIKTGERGYRASLDAVSTNSDSESLALKRLLGWPSDACMGMYTPKETGLTPLHIAAKNGASRVARLLLQYRAATNFYSSFGRTPLHIALTQKNDALVAMLLTYGAKPDALLRERVWLGSGESWGTLPLTLAIRAGSVASVTRLLNAGADINGTDEQGVSSLHQAVTQSAIVELLLARGARVNAKTLSGETPLAWWATSWPGRYGSQGKDEKAGLLLLAHGADVNARDNRGATPLHLAVEVRNEAFVRLLLDHGARINATNYLGQTPLHVAALNNDDKMLALLIARGADRRARTRNVVTFSGSGPGFGSGFGFSAGFGSSPFQENTDQVKPPRNETAEMILQRVKAEVKASLDRQEIESQGWKEREKAEKERQSNAIAFAKDAAENKPTSSLSLGGFSLAQVEAANRHLREAWQKLSGTRYGRALEDNRVNWPPVAQAIAEGANDFTLTLGEAGDSALHVAAFLDDLTTVQTLVQRGLSPDLRNQYQFTPLHRAAEGGAFKVAAFLLARGVAVNAQNNIPTHYPSEGPPIGQESAYTPLHLAARSNAAQLAKLLLEYGGDVRAETTARATPLLIAARNNGDAMARLLLSALSPLSPQERKEALRVAAISNADRVLPLLAHGIDLNAPTFDGQPLLFAAASRGRDKSVAFLLAHGANPNVLGRFNTPLHAAVDARRGGVGGLESFYRHDDGPEPATDSEINRTINVLLDHGAHIDARDEAGRTPLCFIAPRSEWGDDGGSLGSLGLLIARGANVQLATEGGETPLHWATKSNDNKATALLLAHHARPNAKNALGWTPLHQAVWRSKSSAVVSLLKAGASPLVKNKAGVTPLALALKIDAPQDIFMQLQRAVARR